MDEGWAAFKADWGLSRRAGLMVAGGIVAAGLLLFGVARGGDALSTSAVEATQQRLESCVPADVLSEFGIDVGGASVKYGPGEEGLGEDRWVVVVPAGGGELWFSAADLDGEWAVNTQTRSPFYVCNGAESSWSWTAEELGEYWSAEVAYGNVERWFMTEG